MADDSEIRTIELPDPDTIGMINALSRIMEGVANSIPFPFTCTDLMASHLKSAFEVAMMNENDPAKVRDCLVKGLDAIVLDVLEARKQLN